MRPRRSQPFHRSLLSRTSPSRPTHLCFSQLLIWYRACGEALLCLGLPALSGEAPATYLARAQEALSGSPELTGLGKAVCISRYSAHRIARTQVQKAEETYGALLRRMKLTQRIRLYARRIVYGIHL